MSEAISTLAGPKELLEGPTGTGKTHALGTMVDWAEKHGKECFVLFTERKGLETLLGYFTDKGREVPTCLHWRTQATKPIGLQAMIKGAEDVAKLSYESLTKVVDAQRQFNNAFKDLMTCMVDFPDDRTGKKFGLVTDWGTDKILMIDSLTSLCDAVIKMTIGNKPMMAQNEYLVAQVNLMNFIRWLCDLQCTLVLIGHVMRMQDQLTGAMRIMTSSIGKAPADDIPLLFSDVIYATRIGTEFYWDTASANVDTAARSIPIASKIRPDFGQVMDKWLSRGGK